MATIYLEVHSIIHTVEPVSVGTEEAQDNPEDRTEGIAKIVGGTSHSSRELIAVALGVIASVQAEATPNGKKMTVRQMTNTS